MATEIPDNALELVKKWEGLHKVRKDGLVYPYLCPAGVWTIGYGSTRHFDGTPISQHTAPLSPQDCEALMLLELNRCVTSAIKASPILVLFPESLGAVASFIFNLGTGNYRASTFKKKVDSLDWDEAKKQIQKWVYGGGMRLPGLVARRMEEAQYLGL